jgi:hypothetical protein
MTLRTRIFLALALLTIAAGANAQEVRREHRNVGISMGREGRLGYFASPDENCGKGIAPQISIEEHPNYGKIAFRPDRLIAYTSTVPSRAFGCRGKFVDVTAVYYKPAKDFHGSDRAVLRVTFPAANGAADTLFDTIYISVR